MYYYKGLRWYKYRKKSSCRQCNTTHTPTFDAKYTHTHQPHTLHHSYIYKSKIHERHTQSKSDDRSTALARSMLISVLQLLYNIVYNKLTIKSPKCWVHGKCLLKTLINCFILRLHQGVELGPYFKHIAKNSFPFVNLFLFSSPFLRQLLWHIISVNFID